MWNLLAHEIDAGQTVIEEIASDGLPCRSALFGTIAGQTGYTLGLSLEVSPDDGTTWLTLPFVNLTGTDDDTLAAALSITADATKALCGVEWAPKNWPLQVTLVNTGDEAVTVNLWLVATED